MHQELILLYKHMLIFGSKVIRYYSPARLDNCIMVEVTHDNIPGKRKFLLVPNDEGSHSG